MNKRFYRRHSTLSKKDELIILSAGQVKHLFNVEKENF